MVSFQPDIACVRLGGTAIRAVFFSPMLESAQNPSGTSWVIMKRTMRDRIQVA